MLTYKNLEIYKQYLEKAGNLKNMATRLSSMKNFIGYMADKEINHNNIQAYLDTKKTPQSRQVESSYVKHFLIANGIEYTPPKKQGKIYTVSPEIEKFLEIKSYTSCNDKTIDGYRREFSDFFSYIGNEPITEQLCYKYMSKRNISGQTRLIQLLNGYFYYAKIDIKLIPKTKKLENHKLELIKSKLLSRQQLITILNYTNNLNTENLQENNLKTILLFSMFTGSRVAELHNVKLSDINLEDNTIKYLGKGDKIRYVAIDANKYLYNHIKKILKKRKDNNYLLIDKFENQISKSSMQIAVKNVFIKLGFPQNKSIHSFRHSFATTLYEKGVDINHIQAILGHSSLETTKIYTKISNVANKAIKGKLNF